MIRSQTLRNSTTKPFRALTFPALRLLPLGVEAQERLCDTQSEDCRAPLIDLTRNGRIGIDVAGGGYYVGWARAGEWLKSTENSGRI